MRSAQRLAAAGAVFLLGTAQAAEINANVSGGATITAQHADDRRVKSEALASFDLFIAAPYVGGDWTVHIEGNTGPRPGYVASVIREANADAGTAVTSDRQGNIQVSEFNYRRTLDVGGTLTAGMVDVPAYFDTADTATDENTKFIGVGFKHNLTIEFPDYTLGLIYQRQLGERGPELTFALASSHGLANNPGANYAQALNVDSRSKGAFLAAGCRWSGEEWHSELGAWSHTAPHQSLDGSSSDKYNYGAFAVIGRDHGNHAFDLRFGGANPDVFEAKAYAGLTYELRRDEAVYGVGAARTWLAPKAAGTGKGDMSQYEIYARFHLWDGLALSPHVQHIVNSGFDSSGANYSPKMTIVGVRLDYLL